MAFPFLKNRREKKVTTENRYLLWGLIAVELFMSFSFLGYVHIEPISITFVYIPVLVAACLLGAKEGALVGAIFGLAAMWKASAYYVGIGDTVFSPAMSGKPIESVFLSVGTRALFGLITGIFYTLAKKGKHPMTGILVVNSLGRTLHAFLVYGYMGIAFPETGFSAVNTIDDVLRWDFIPFLVFVNVIICFCYIFWNSDYIRKLNERIRIIDQINGTAARGRKGGAAMLILVFAASFSVAVYFTNRIESVMASHEIILNESAAYDVMHLQIQFLLGIMSLAFLVILVVILYQKNFNYLYYEAKLDGLTGLLSRRQFFQVGAGMLNNMRFVQEDKNKTGCFVILDVDRFKEINDEYGHPTGDRILKEVAQKLKEVFGNRGILGRLGGDEFVALIHYPMSREEIETLLHEFEKGLEQIPGEAVTCSIGVIPVEKNYTIEELYRSADRLLYEAKKRGRNQFVFGYRFPRGNL